MREHTEPLLGLAIGLDDLDNTGTERLNGWYVVGENTHVTGSSSNVYLSNIGRLVQRLIQRVSNENTCELNE